MIKHAIKFLAGTGFMVLIGFGVLYALHFFSPEYRQEQAAIQKLKEIQDQYAKDTYGGETPEETIQLFIDALKKGDTDLAAKYFVIDKQEEWKKDLTQIKEKNLMQFMLQDLDRIELSKKTEDEAFFVVTNLKNKITTQMVIQRNKLNNKWKIIEL